MFKPQPPEFPSTTALVAKSLLPVTEEEKAKQPEGSLLMSEEFKNILRSLKQYFLERNLLRPLDCLPTWLLGYRQNPDFQTLK